VPPYLTTKLSFLALLGFIGFIIWSLWQPKTTNVVVTPSPSIPEICDKRDFNISLDRTIQQLQELERKQGDQFSAITLMGNFPFMVIDLIPYRSLKTAFFLIQIARIVRKSKPITPAKGFLSIPVNQSGTVPVYLIN
jgi:hypothetical protein